MGRVGTRSRKAFRRAVTKLPMKREERTDLFLSLSEPPPHISDGCECFLNINGLGIESRVHALVEDTKRGHLTRRRTKAGCLSTLKLAKGRIECIGWETDACCGVFQL